MTHYESVHTETVKGFDIELSITPEEQAPDWYFETDAERDVVVCRSGYSIKKWCFIGHRVFRGLLLRKCGRFYK